MVSHQQMAIGLLVAAYLGLVLWHATTAPAHPTAPGAVETVVLFDVDMLDTPENIAIDHDNNIYISLALTGEIRQLAPDGTASTVATLPLGAPPLTVCGSFFAGLTGLTLDASGTLYANLASCDPASRGVWKLPRAGPPARIAALPLEALPNGIVHHHGAVYTADSTLGVIWRVSDEGGTAAVRARGAELAPHGSELPGPNGLKLFQGELYVSNPSQTTIVAITVEPDGTAGAARIHASGVFCDDFAFDVFGRLYCGTDPFNTLLRIAPDGAVETLITAGDGLDGPTAVAFGHRGDRFALYVTTAAFPFVPMPPPRRPSLMRVSLDVPGFLPP